MSKSVVLSSVAAASVCLVALSAVANINDALVYDMALIPTDGPVTKDHIYNRLTHSAATRQTAASVSTFSGSTDVCGTPDPITITEERLNAPGCLGVFYTEPVLTLPQSTYEDADGNVYTFRQGVTFDNMPLSSNMTVYCRMYYDKTNYDTKYEGLAARMFDLAYASGNGTTTRSSGCYLEMLTKPSYQFSYLRFNYGYYKNTSMGGYVKLPKSHHDCWYDIVIVLRTDDSHTYVTCYTRINGGPFMRQNSDKTETDEFMLTDYIASIESVMCFKTKKVTLGCDPTAVTGTGWVKLDKYSNRQSFRGKMSRFRIYNRPLTTAEVRGLLSEANGGAALVGRPDGTSEEFAAADESAAAEAFNPYEMPTSKMRGTLTAAHPTLTIDCPLKGSEVGMSKVLSVKPVLANLGAGAPSLDVAVNGTKVGSLDFFGSDAKMCYVKGKLVASNEYGNVRYTLTRTGNLSGELGSDAVEIAGSWGEGIPHEGTSSRDPSGVITAALVEESYVGRIGATNYMMSCLFGPRNGGAVTIKDPVTAINFYVPEDVAANRETTYTFGFGYADRSKKGAYPLMDLYLNGAKVGETLNPISWWTPFSWTFPAGTLNAGYNTLTISNATPVEAVATADYYATIHVNYHRFSVKPPPSGMTIIVR